MMTGGSSGPAGGSCGPEHQPKHVERVQAEDGGGPRSHGSHSRFSLEHFHPLIQAAKTLLGTVTGSLAPADLLIFPGLTPAGPSDEDSELGSGQGVRD